MNTLHEKVYAFLKTVPAGTVVTYGQIACFLGNKHMARAVGNILHKNPDPANIPCHRVVNARGEVSNAYAFGGAEAQRRYLEAEGIRFSPDGRINLSQYGMNL